MKRKATAKDFSTGVKLTTSEGFEFVLTSPAFDGFWNARGNRGMKLIHENEAQWYTI